MLHFSVKKKHIWLQYSHSFNKFSSACSISRTVLAGGTCAWPQLTFLWNETVHQQGKEGKHVGHWMVRNAEENENLFLSHFPRSYFPSFWKPSQINTHCFLLLLPVFVTSAVSLKYLESSAWCNLFWCNLMERSAIQQNRRELRKDSAPLRTRNSRNTLEPNQFLRKLFLKRCYSFTPNQLNFCQRSKRTDGGLLSEKVRRLHV